MPSNLVPPSHRPKQRWRTYLLLLSLLFSTQAGCRSFDRFSMAPSAPIPVAYQQPPSLETVIADMNARAGRARQLSSSATIKISNVPTKIRGTLQVEFPNKMRLKGTVGGLADVVDAGSNDQHFWVWSKIDLPGQPAAMYYASHDGFRNSPNKQQIPLEPQWLIDALGVVTLDPNGRHLGPFPDNQGRMRIFTQLGDGSWRVMLLNASTGVVEQTSVYNANNQLVGYANARKFKVYDQYNVSLPQQIELHMPQSGQQDLQATIDFGTFSINSLYGDANQMWSMPDGGRDQKINLGR